MFKASRSRGVLALGASMAALCAAAPALAQATDSVAPAQPATAAKSAAKKPVAVKVAQLTNRNRTPTSVSNGPAASAAQSAPPTNTVGTLIVTAQRRSENIQNVPVAVSAFSASALKAQRLDGGKNLEISIPNVNFSNENFGGFNLSIRGVGEKVVGEGGTSGVSFNINELPLAANQFANTDFFDVERVEVDRGPQGTLFGRNSTGGAVNIVTNKPTDTYSGSITGEYGNYDSKRVLGYINLPVTDTVAVRVAGVYLNRGGFGENSVTGNSVDGRDLHDVRGTISWKPNDRFSAYVLAENYFEDDDRNRVGKQLCIKDPSKTQLAGVALNAENSAFLNQGCQEGSLYQPNAYGTLNSNGTLAGVLTNITGLTSGNDLFGNHPLQNTNLHDIESAVDPHYTANETFYDFHAAYNVTDNLTLENTVGYNRNTGTSSEDYNRLVPLIPFNATSSSNSVIGSTGLGGLLFKNAGIVNGVVPDAQVGTSNFLRDFDYGDTSSTELTEELRLTSSFKGPVNFSVGGIYTDSRFATDYYVLSNALTQFARVNNALSNLTGGAINAVSSSVTGNPGGLVDIGGNSPPDPSGHNYYDSKDNFRDRSTGFFGEVYYQVLSDVKLTLGARYSTDRYRNLAYPVELEDAGAGFPAPGTPEPTFTGANGTPQTILTEQYQDTAFKAWTGRFNVEWTPHVSFTNQTQVYATYSHGYKPGGFNTPSQNTAASSTAESSATNDSPYPIIYSPETIDSIEVGTKNTLLGGRLVLNADGFFYNYTGYQVSKIVNESSVNENINAHIYGIEFEGIYSPIHNVTLNSNFGYLHTQITGGSSLDELNITQGEPSLTLVKGTNGSNCVVNTDALAALIQTQEANGAQTLAPTVENACSGNTVARSAATIANGTAGNSSTPQLYNYAGLNVTTTTPPGSNVAVGEGVETQLKGKELPNTPEFTVSLGAQYVYELPLDWRATIRADGYWQAHSYSRIYNTSADFLESWYNLNSTLTFDNAPLKLNVQFYVKNAFNAQPLTDTYVTDPTSGLFTNTFTLDPRTYGVSVTKRF